MEEERTTDNTPVSQPSSATPAAATNSLWGWFDVAKSQALEIAAKAQVYAEQAGKVAQEKALEIAKQAQELQEKYDLEVATSILMGTTGSTSSRPPEANVNIDAIKLTKSDLAALDMVYVTENILAMAFPKDKSLPAHQQSPAIAEQEGGNDINIVAAYLRKKHANRFMIWNISEESYDYTKFSDQVLEYKFPGHPAPPLGLLFKICTSVESWLDADEKNIAVIHCLTGKGRTATLIACILTWLGEFDSPMQALQYTAQRKNTIVDYLTIPSQRRYIQYFSNLLDGVKPNSEPLLLRRVIMNSIPQFGSLPEVNVSGSNNSGCCPYIQLFKTGKLVASAAVEMEKSSSTHTGGAAEDGAQQQQQQQQQKMILKWVSSADGSASFRIDTLVQGDILLRCRHASMTGARVSMFRAAFHTGYISGGVLRLTKAQLDGAASDARFSEEFFIDLIFAAQSEAVLLTTATTGGSSGNASNAAAPTAATTEAALSDKYETGLHKDARFWETITARKAKSKKRKTRKFLESQQDQFSIADDSKVLLSTTTATTTSSSAVTTAMAKGDEKNIIEIDFTGNNNKGKNSSSNNNYDEDLIKQLALLESETNDLLAASSSSKSNNNNNYSTTATPTTTTTTTATINTTIVTPGKGSAVKNEIDALEDLEKELGLTDLQLISTTTPSASTAYTAANSNAVGSSAKKATTTTVDDDNLDELEQYLQSLSK